MTLKLITGPAAEPLTLTEAKLHLKVEHTVDDTLITSLIVAARRAAEHETGRPFITQTWERVLDAFPCDDVIVLKPGVLSITSLKYLDTAGVEQTASSSIYLLDADSQPGRLLPAYATYWPTTRDTANAVRVQFTCGYGADATAVPDCIKRWMCLHIGKFYANREALVDGRMVAMPDFDSLLDSERVWGA